MSEYHGKMMNIQVDIKKVMDVEREENSRMIAYKLGHRDARHDAAEIAIKADIEIARLKGQLQTAREALEELRSIGESAEIGAYSKNRLITKILCWTQEGLRSAEALKETEG